jgi:hypothetical protein
VSSTDEVREYRFVEAVFEQVPRWHVPPVTFEPDPEFFGTGTRSGFAPERLDTPPVPAVEFERLSPAQLAAIEMEMFHRLHLTGACMREPSSISTTPAGGLRLEAIVETPRRKQELLSSLGSLARPPAVTIEIYTVAEAASQQVELRRAPVISGRVEIAAHRIALYADLRQYFASTLNDPDSDPKRVEDLIRGFTGRVLRHSRQALIHAQTVRRHLTDFSRGQVQGVAPGDEARRRAMIREHLAAMKSETRRLRLELEPVFFNVGPGQGLAGEPRRQDRTRDIEKLIESAIEHERVIRMALTLSSGGQSLEIKTAEFMRSLRHAESLAAALEKGY